MKDKVTRQTVVTCSGVSSSKGSFVRSDYVQGFRHVQGFRDLGGVWSGVIMCRGFVMCRGFDNML
ncbi:hypothetical protein HanPI659440_Chr03g0132941 [Helianthus annuus]|nr:hypothetical protein HanPI659440_Chr03g0132941 [Helianthus annuus]